MRFFDVPYIPQNSKSIWNIKIKFAGPKNNKNKRKSRARRRKSQYVIAEFSIDKQVLKIRKLSRTIVCVCVYIFFSCMPKKRQ